MSASLQKPIVKSREQIVIDNFIEGSRGGSDATRLCFQQELLKSIKTLSHHALKALKGNNLERGLYSPDDYLALLKKNLDTERFHRLRDRGSIIDGYGQSQFFKKIPDSNSITGFKIHTLQVRKGEASAALDHLIKGVTLLGSSTWPCIAYHLAIRNFLRIRSVHDDQDHLFNQIFSSTGPTPLRITSDIKASSLRPFIYEKFSNLDVPGDIVILDNTREYSNKHPLGPHRIIALIKSANQQYFGFIPSQKGFSKSEISNLNRLEYNKTPHLIETSPFIGKKIKACFSLKAIEIQNRLKDDQKFHKLLRDEFHDRQIFSIDYSQLLHRLI